MARTQIALQDQLAHQIVEAVFTAAATEMYFKNNGFVKLVIAATAAFAGGTVTVKSRTDGNRRTGDIVITVAASDIWESSFFEVMLFNNGGVVDVDVSVTTGLSISAIRQAV